MRVLFHDFLSHRAVFFDKLDDSAKHAENMAAVLATLVTVENADQRVPLFKQVDKLERTVQDITHKIYLCLDKIFFTPLNRNDIHTLATALDAMADMIQEASARLNLYNIVDFVNPVKEMTALLLLASAAVQKAVTQLRHNNNYNQILDLCREAKSYERQADQVYYNALAELFLHDKDPINLLKYREIYHSLETALNKCKCAADALEVILINR